MEPQTKVTQEEVDALLYQCAVEEHIFWHKELVVSYKLPNGFIVHGSAACVSPTNFDLQTGRKIARQKVADTVWLILGYQLQQDLYNKGLNNES